MDQFEWKPLATRKTREAVIKFVSKLLDAPVRSLRLCVAIGRENNPEYGMKIFRGELIVDRYEIRFRDGSYTIFDTWGK